MTSGTCSTPVRSENIGSTRTCTVTELAPDTDSQFRMVAYRGTYPSAMVHGLLSDEVSGSTTMEPDSAAVPGSTAAPEVPDPAAQPQPGGGSAGHPNEPAGLGVISSIGFANGIEAQVGSCVETGDAWKLGNMKYISDSSAPTGDGRVFRGRFPAGMKDGASPWRFDCWDPSVSAGSGANDYSEIYISYWLYIEGSDFENQTQGTKTLYWAHGSTIRNNHSAGRLDGTYSGQAVMDGMQRAAYIYEMRDDGSDAGGGATHRTPNVNNKKVEPGHWQQLEIWMKINDIGPTKDNGAFKMWVDGVLTHDLTGLRWRSDQNPKGFYHVQFTPVYGGNSGDVRTRDDYWRIDELRISGRK